MTIMLAGERPTESAVNVWVEQYASSVALYAKHSLDKDYMQKLLTIDADGKVELHRLNGLSAPYLCTFFRVDDGETIPILIMGD